MRHQRRRMRTVKALRKEASVVHLLVRAIEGFPRAKAMRQQQDGAEINRMPAFCDSQAQNAGTRRAKGIFELLLVSLQTASSAAFRRAKRDRSTEDCSRPLQDLKLSLAAASEPCRAFGSFSSFRTQQNPTDKKSAQICTAFAVDARKATKNVHTTTPTPPRRLHDTCAARRPRRPRPRRRPPKQ